MFKYEEAETDGCEEARCADQRAVVPRNQHERGRHQRDRQRRQDGERHEQYGERLRRIDVTRAVVAQSVQPAHLEEEGLVVGRGAYIQPVGRAERRGGRSGRQVRPFVLVRAARSERHALSTLLGQPPQSVELGRRPGTGANERRGIELVQDVSAHHHDDVALGVLDPPLTRASSARTVTRRPCVSHQTARPSHVQHTIGTEAIQVFVEGLDGVEVVLAESEGLGRAPERVSAKPM